MFCVRCSITEVKYSKSTNPKSSIYATLSGYSMTSGGEKFGYAGGLEPGLC
jgi:hypothetical protein